MSTEADTCRILITPKHQAVGWDSDPCSTAEQAGKPDADPLDLLCDLDFKALWRTPPAPQEAQTSSNSA